MDFSKCVNEIHYKNFSGKDIVLKCVYSKYLYGGIALQLLCKSENFDGYEPYMTASVCVDGLEDDEIAIKDYSENEGIYEALVEQKVIHEAHRTVSSGFVIIPVCRLRTEDDFELAFKPPIDIDVDTAYKVHCYMMQYSREEDIYGMIYDRPKFKALSKEEKAKVISNIATKTNDILDATGHWYEIAEDCIDEWLNK